MNKKIISIFVIIVIFIGYVIYSMFWMGPGTSPISYVNIQEFEKSENVKVHHFYDIEEYIMNDKKELLIDSSKKFHITGKHLKVNMFLMVLKQEIYLLHIVLLQIIQLLL